MNANRLRTACGLVIVASVAGAGPQLPKNDADGPTQRAGMQILEQKAKEHIQQYEQGKKQFFVARDKAASALVSRFDTVEKKFRANTRLPAELRTAKVKKITNEKNAFRANGALPVSDEMLGSLLEYHETLYKAQLPVAKSYEELFNLYSLKLKDDSRAATLTADKEAFDQKIRGHVFQPSNWQGTQSGNNNIPFVLNVESLDGNSIKGRIVQDRFPNETVFKVEGILSGNRVKLLSTQVVQGGARTLIFTGYVTENRILGQVVSVARDGKRSGPSLALLYRR
jgi:hypothetical protein